MKKAIQFGAGNIGRGFIGAVLEQAGYHVVFADVNEQVVARINSDRAYTVQIMDTVCEQMRITDISAMDSRSPELAAQIAGAELVTTAVGLTVLPRIAGAIAAGIAARRDAGVTEPLNVIACENGVRATTQLREAVLKHLDEAQRDWCEQYVGFPDCSVDRIVPPVKSENPIDVVVERFFEWNVERAAFKGAVPEIPGMNPADNLIAYIERKLFTLNTGHAITAYLGRMKGYMTICQSISDEHIHTIVKAAMRESGRGLVALYGFDRDAHFAYIDKIIGRFTNPYLCDDVTRVGREPLRKLSAGDRLVKPVLTARQYGIGTPNLLLGIGAASNFSLHLGAGEEKKAVEYAGTGLCLMAICGIALFLVTTLFLTPMLKFFGATPDVLPYAEEYTRITAIGFPFLIANT
ncbi:MAG: mannitol-1-phosphate 5-dehydrogenase, partial [Alistipes onderdonkii]|nr:mannitol-1-phosphate 5-dehydrogenase [Alistipes onderdonkii]